MNHQTDAPTERFNLVCHGMMAFWQTGADRMSILIPDEGAMHSYRIGSVAPRPGETPSIANLELLLPGSLELKGIRPGQLRKEELREQLDMPLLKVDEIDIVDGQVRSRIDIPMPDRIRHYSGVEVNPDAVRGATPIGSFRKLPSLLHDVVVLSWFDSQAREIYVLHEGGTRYSAVARPGRPARLAIHAQPAVPIHPHPVGHGRGWNRMFRFKNGGGMPDLQLSIPNLIPDGPPRTTAIGLEEADLLSLVRAAGFVTDPAGCAAGGGSC